MNRFLSYFVTGEAPSLRLAPAALKYSMVAVIFGMCGALSSFLLNQDSAVNEHAGVAVAFPFAVLCFFLLKAPKPAWLLVVPLNVVVWQIAYKATILIDFMLSGRKLRHFIPPCIGGVIGGLCVALCDSIGHRRLLSSKHLFAAAIIGGISALSFGLWLDADWHGGSDLLPTIYFRLGFAVWQAAVGTYLYAVCTGAQKSARPDASHMEN